MIIRKPKILILISVTLSILILSCSSNSINEDIVYSANKNGNIDIYKITLKDFEVTRLTTNEEIDTQPRWSNNKSKIAFLSKRSSRPFIFIVLLPSILSKIFTGSPIFSFSFTFISSPSRSHS